MSNAQTTNSLHAMLSQGRLVQVIEEESDRFLRQLSDFNVPDKVFPLTSAMKVLPISWPSAGKLSKLTQLPGRRKEEILL